MTQSPSPIPLPELHQAELDATTVEQLFTDIAQCAQVVEVRHKYGSRRRVGAPSHATLEEACKLLLQHQVRGVQIQYLYDGGVWCDTLLRSDGGFRLTRIRQDLPPPHVGDGPSPSE